MNLKRRVLALALIPVLGVPLAACDQPDTCDAISLSITGVDAGGKGGGKSGRSRTTTGGGSHSDDDCDD